MEQDVRLGSSRFRFSFEGRPDADKVPELQEAIDEFSTINGKAKEWTEKTLDQRIAAVGNALGMSIQSDLDMARLMIYRQASEALHGTLYSTLYFCGYLEMIRPINAEKLANTIADQHILILNSAIHAVSACLESFHKQYAFQSAEDRRKPIIEELIQVLKRHVNYGI